MGLFGLFAGGSNYDFEIGDKVRIKYREQEGYIIDINGSLYTVSVDNGAFVDSFSADELEHCY